MNIVKRLLSQGWRNALKIGILHAESICFDMRYGTDTWRRVPLSRLTISSELQSHGTNYDGSPVSALRRALRVAQVSASDVFVDFGCGKGRALLIAAEFPFRKVLGIEFSEELCHIAEKNIQCYRNRRRVASSISVLCRDAASCVIEDDWNMFFFFNPFDGIVMKRVMQNIEASLTRTRRPIQVLYYAPVRRVVLDQCNRLRLQSRLNIMGREFLLYRSIE